MLAHQRPSREDQVAIDAATQMNVRLKEMAAGVEVFGQQPRLIVEPRSRHMPIDFLQANQIGVFGFDDIDDPGEMISSIAPPDPLVHVVAQQAH